MSKLRTLSTLIAMAVTLALATSLARGGPIEGHIWWAPELMLDSLTDLPSALAQPVTDHGKPVTVELMNSSSKRTVRSCNEYLAAVDAKMYPANEMGSDSPFIERCFALRYLRHVSHPKQSLIPATWNADSLQRLPPFIIFVESSLSAKAAQARAAHESWHQYDPSLTVSEHTQRALIFENSTNRWMLKTVASGDFNADGFNDELVIACDSKKVDGGGICFPIVLTAFRPDDVMTDLSSTEEPYPLEQKPF